MKQYKIVLDWAYEEEDETFEESLEWARNTFSNCVFEKINETGPSGWPEVLVYSEVEESLKIFLRHYLDLDQDDPDWDDPQNYFNSETDMI